MEIKTVGVVGAGLMGHGIAQVAAQSGCAVVLREVSREALDAGVGRIEGQLARAVEKGRMDQDEADAVRGRIDATLDYADLAGCDLVIEAVTEDLATKLEMWKAVDAVVRDGAIFATNTSSLSVIEQTVVTGRPERFLGLHYFNPAQGDEARRGRPLRDHLGRDDRGRRQVRGEPEQARRPDARPRRLHRQPPARPFMLDAIRAYEEGVGTIGEIDAAMKAGAGHPMGPLALADFVGLDTLGSICDVMFDEFRERRFAMPPTLRKMLAAGWHGRKSGTGFYDYSSDEPTMNPQL